MTTLKVSPTGDGSDGLTWGTAYQTINAALTVAITATDNIEVDGGTDGITYNEAIDNTKLVNITGSYEVGHNGGVTLNSSDTYTYRSRTANVLGNVTVTGGVYAVRPGPGSIFNFVKGVSGSTCALYYPDATGIVQYNFCAFLDGPSRTVLLGGASSGASEHVFNYCRISGDKYTGQSYGAITAQFCAAITLNNCDLIGNTRAALSGYTGAAVITLNNCIIAANGGRNIDTKIVYKNAAFTGTITINNPIILPCGPAAARATGALTYDVDTLTGGFTENDPDFAVSRRDALTCIIIDDNSNYEHWTQVAELAETKGLRTVHAVDQTASLNYGWWGGMREYIDRGHEIACHTRHHPDVTNLAAIDITCTGTNPTVDIYTNDADGNSENWTGYIHCNEDGVIVRSIVIARPTNLNTIVSIINTLDGWSATLNASANGQVFCCCLEDGEVDANGTLMLSQEKFYYTEIAESKRDIETGIGNGYICRAFVSPGNVSSADLRAYLRDDVSIYQGHWAKAGVAHFDCARVGTAGSEELEQIDIYQIFGFSADQLPGIHNQARDAIAYFVDAAYHGLVNAMYSHSADQFSIVEFNNYINTIQTVSGVKILTLSGIRDRIVNSGLWAHDGDGVYTRAFDDASWEPRIASNSPGKMAGVVVTGVHDKADLATDIFGNPVYYTPSIGLHEVQGPNLTVNENDYTPTGWSIRKGAHVTVRGDGDVDFSGLSETTGLIKVDLIGYIKNYTPLAGITTRKTNDTASGGGGSSLILG
nr:hypothetical protein [uncultured Desulfobacter sp.]